MSYGSLTVSKSVGERIPLKEILLLKLQILVDYLFFPVVGIATVFFFRFIHKSNIRNHKEIRRQFQDITRDRRPILICANHLTMFDSIFIHYALNGVLGYLKEFRLFSWNTPAVENFKSTAFLSIFTYLGKTIPIDRTGSSDHHKLVLNKVRYLLENGEICTIFPEGGRSRTGRVEPANVTYGVGNILSEMENYRVLCIYIRGDKQETHSPLPPYNDRIYMKMEIIEPETEQTGRRAARDISVQIIDKIKSMEDDYFHLREEGKLDQK